MPPTDVNQAQKSFGQDGGGGHGAYNQRIKVIAKMLKKSRVGRGGGCQGGYEQRIEVIVKIAQKKS